MKLVRKIIATVMGLMLLAGLGTIAVSAATAEDLAGIYPMFGVQQEGYLVLPEVIGVTAQLELNADGTGSLEMNGEATPLKEWTVEGDVLQITDTYDGYAEGTIQEDGVILLEIAQDVFMYLAAEGTDTSSYHLMNTEELLEQMAADEAARPKPDSLLYAVYAPMDLTQGVHLNYDMHLEALDTTSNYDVLGKDGIYYSRRQLAGEEYAKYATISFFQDGNMYSLDEYDKTGTLATSTDSEYVKQHYFEMDSLYSAINRRAKEFDYTEEEREYEGKTYTAEIYPEIDEYPYEEVFLFDEDGQLAYYLVTISDSLGEEVFTINLINDAVDESLLDISGYEITPLSDLF